MGLFLLLAIPVSFFIIQKKPAKDQNWKGVIAQTDTKSCGPAALLMILKHYGVESNLNEIIGQIKISEKGTSMQELKMFAERKGLLAEGWKLRYSDLINERKPLIVLMDQVHFVVLDSIKMDTVYIRDPLRGAVSLPSNKFMKSWDGETLKFEF